MILRLKSFGWLLALTLNFSAPFLTAATGWQKPPQEFEPSYSERAGAIAAGTNSSAIVLTVNNFTGNLNASPYTNGAWQPPEFETNANTDDIAFAMDETGTGIAMWQNNLGELNTLYYNGSTWSTPTPNPLDIPLLFFNYIDVAMNGAGLGLAVWVDGTSTFVSSSQFTAGNWTPPVVIGFAPGSARVAYSLNGSGVAAFNNAGSISVVNYLGGTWQSPIVLTTGVFSDNVQVGIDANGRALASWVDDLGNVVYSFYNGATWLTPEIVSSIPGNFIDISLAMSSNGTAVLAYVNANSNGYYTVFNGTGFSSPTQFGTGFDTTFPSVDVAINSSGNALIIYGTATNEVRSRFYYQGNLGSDNLVHQITDSISSLGVQAALSSDNKPFALWQISSIESINVQASVYELNPTSPVYFCGKTSRNKFVTQTDHVHILNWGPAIDAGVIAYELRRNGNLIFTTGANGPYSYIDHNRCRGHRDVYTLVSIAEGGFESSVSTVTLR